MAITLWALWLATGSAVGGQGGPGRGEAAAFYVIER